MWVLIASENLNKDTVVYSDTRSIIIGIEVWETLNNFQVNILHVFLKRSFKSILLYLKDLNNEETNTAIYIHIVDTGSNIFEGIKKYGTYNQ